MAEMCGNGKALAFVPKTCARRRKKAFVFVDVIHALKRVASVHTYIVLFRGSESENYGK